MVLILDGNLEIGAHVWGKTGNLICYNYINSCVKFDLFSTHAQGVLSYLLLYVPWNITFSGLGVSRNNERERKIDR